VGAARSRDLVSSDLKTRIRRSETGLGTEDGEDVLPWGIIMNFSAKWEMKLTNAEKRRKREMTSTIRRQIGGGGNGFFKGGGGGGRREWGGGGGGGRVAVGDQRGVAHEKEDG